jgi:hypothetical protein
VNINLVDCPEILQEEAKKYLSGHSDGKIICITKHECTPYKDKNIVLTTYTVGVQEHNYFTTFVYMIPSDANYSNLGVIKNSMTAGEIRDIIANAEDGYFEGLKAKA